MIRQPVISFGACRWTGKDGRVAICQPTVRLRRYAANALGANVTLISGPVNIPKPENLKLVDVSSAQQMHEAVMDCISDCDIFVGCAAVADYKPTQKTDQKIKKNDKNRQNTL